MNRILKDITVIVSGYPFRGKIHPSITDGVPVIQMKDVSDGDVDWGSVIRSELTGKKHPDWLQNGDLLCAGKAHNNYFLLLKDLPDQSVCSPHFFHLRIKNEQRVLPEYLNWLLNSRKIQSRLKAQQMGTTTFSIRKETLLNLSIPVPPISEQRHIVELVNIAHSQNKLQQQLITNNEQLMESLAQQAFKKYGSL